MGLTTLERRRLRGDLIETYKIVTGKEKISSSQFFARRPHKSRLVAINSARLEQRRGMLTFDKIMKFVVYYTANFPHWYWLCSTLGVASRKPEAEINDGWWRLRVLGWNKLETWWHVVHVVGPYLLWSNGCMDQDETWYTGKPRTQPHCVRWGPWSPPPKGHSPPIFGPSVVAKWLAGLTCHLVWRSVAVYTWR